MRILVGEGSPLPLVDRGRLARFSVGEGLAPPVVCCRERHLRWLHLISRVPRQLLLKEKPFLRDFLAAYGSEMRDVRERPLRIAYVFFVGEGLPLPFVNHRRLW